jgi:hypothetical protein
MRKVSILALVFCLILGLSVVAMAKEDAKPAKPAAMTAKGDVSNVNLTDKTLSITGKDKPAEQLFWTTDKTKITKNGKPAKLDDVKVGDWAEVWYTEKDGKNWATKVVAKSPKNPKK